MAFYVTKQSITITDIQKMKIVLLSKLSGGKFNFEWQKQVVEKGPMCGLLILRLSERKKREFEIQQLLEKKQEEDNNY